MKSGTLKWTRTCRGF